MGRTHYEVAVHFAKRDSEKNVKGHSVFTGRGNTEIYSWGSHFVMAYANDDAKIVVINGDRYSVSTSRHQSELRGALQTYLPKDYQSIIIPFSVLDAAQVGYGSVVPIDAEPDFEDAVCETHNLRFDTKPNDSAYSQLYAHKYSSENNSYDDPCKTHYEHRLGGSLFKAYDRWNYESGGWKYFLSGFDETHNGNTDGYFISLLPHPVKTIAEAYESLKPLAVRKAIAAGLDVKRQGDAFAVPIENLNVRRLRRDRVQMEEYDLPYWMRTADKTTGMRRFVPAFWPGYSHGATQVAYKTANVVYGRGQLIHAPNSRPPEHKRINLGKIWHRIYKNTAIRSWASTSGRVD